MKQSNYKLQNFIRVIYRKVEDQLQDVSITQDRFNQYCLAVQLFHLQKWKSQIIGLPFSNEDKQNFERLCSKFGFISEQHGECKEDNRLEGLPPDAFSYTEVIGKLQLLINYFSQYEVLKRYIKESSVKEEYERTCDNLEKLRKEFRLPPRFKYNKTKRKDNPFFRGGVEVIVP